MRKVFAAAMMLGMLAMVPADADAQRRWSRKAKGATVGAASGAVIGGVAKGKKGAVVGAAAGAGTGYLIGRHKDRKRGKR